MRLSTRFLNLPSIVALSWTTFQLWVVFSGSYHALIQRPIHVAFAMALVFLTKPFKKGKKKEDEKPYTVMDILLALITGLCALYSVLNYERITTRIPFVDSLSSLDVLVGMVFIVLLLEATRRAVNLALAAIALFFLLYGFIGPVLPGLLGHGGQTIAELAEVQMYSTTGIFSSPTGVSVNMVFYFLLFGAFLSMTPAGKLFIDIAQLFTRRSKGGAGKAAIVASALFGMISGSAPANVASTGSITYPMMKSQGFTPKFSGSLLSVAGTGGQIIPPIMGAAAFIMVDMLGASYTVIMKTAIIPAFIYVAALYILAHLEACKHNIHVIIEDTGQLKKAIVKRIYLLLAVVVLVTLIVMGRSLMFSATYATIFLLVLCMLKKETRTGIYKILETLESTAKKAIIVAIPCALAGIIVGEIVFTGLGVRFSSMISALSEGNLLLALFFTMIMAIILGMGMPTSAAYIMCAVLLAPAMVNIGVEPIVAHFFIFYFANLSMVTPPVALASYAAAGIVDMDMWSVGWSAFKFSLVIFLLPYAFVYNPALLGIGTMGEIIWVTITTLLGAWAIGMAIIGYGFANVLPFERILLVIASLTLIVPEKATDLAGIAILVLAIALQLNRNKKKKTISTLNS